MIIKYQVIKQADNGQRTIVKTFNQVEEAIEYRRTLKDGYFNFYDIVVVFFESKDVQTDAKIKFAELYQKVAKGGTYHLEPFPEHELWIDQNGLLIAGDYFADQGAIINFLEWADVI